MKDININDINIHGYYITADEPNIKVPLEPQDEIFLSDRDLIELVLPKCCDVYCYNNLLTKLIIPDGCEYIDCSNNNLIKLILPKSCELVCCYDNKLPQVIINLFQSKDPIKIQLANNLQLTQQYI